MERYEEFDFQKAYLSKKVLFIYCFVIDTNLSVLFINFLINYLCPFEQK